MHIAAGDDSPSRVALLVVCEKREWFVPETMFGSYATQGYTWALGATVFAGTEESDGNRPAAVPIPPE